MTIYESKKTPSLRLPCALLLLSSALLPASARAGDAYLMTDLGSLGGTFAVTTAINKSGQVVGYSTDSGGSYHATLYSGTGSNNTNLGDLTGGTAGQAYGINDAGTIVGWAYDSSTFYAVRFSGTGLNNTNLGAINGTHSQALAINNSGQIVGISDDNTDPHFGSYATSFGSPDTNLGALNSGNSVAYAINNSGTVVGASNYPGVSGRATIFNGAGGIKDLGDLGAGPGSNNNSYAYAINDAGVIVGGATLTPGGSFHAVIYSGTGANNTDLGTLGGSNAYAYGINNAGLIVGSSQYTTNSTFHGFIYKNGVMTDLNSITVNQAGSGISNIRIYNDSGSLPGRCLNDAGQIAAAGSVGPNVHALLLTPYYFLATSTSISGTSFSITFNTIASKTYRLERNADLSNNAGWQSIAGVSDYTAPSNGTHTLTDPNGVTNATGGKAFYRVRIL